MELDVQHAIEEHGAVAFGVMAVGLKLRAAALARVPDGQHLNLSAARAV
jgi:hypothetical protein